MVCVLLGACTASRPSATPARDPAIPTSLTLLDARYSIPGYLTVSDVVRTPGMARFSWRDDVSTCSGVALVETVASAEDHAAFMQREIFAAYERNWTAQHVLFVSDDAELTLWNGPARLRVYTLSGSGRDGATGTLDRHVAEDAFSMVVVFDCSAPALARKQAETWIRVLETRQRI